MEGYERGSGGFRYQLRPGGRSTSRSSTHDHKYSSIRSSLSYLWQNLRVRIRAPESSSFSPSVCFLASATVRLRRSSTDNSKHNKVEFSGVGDRVDLLPVEPNRRAGRTSSREISNEYRPISGTMLFSLEQLCIGIWERIMREE